MEKQKILIADDSEMNRALLVDILENQYDIVEADNGAGDQLIFLHSAAEIFRFCFWIS